MKSYLLIFTQHGSGLSRDYESTKLHVLNSSNLLEDQTKGQRTEM